MFEMIGLVGIVCILASIALYGWSKTLISTLVGIPSGGFILGGAGYLLALAAIEFGNCMGMGCLGYILFPIFGAIGGAFIGFFTVLWFLVKGNRPKRKRHSLTIG